MNPYAIAASALAIIAALLIAWRLVKAADDFDKIFDDGSE